MNAVITPSTRSAKPGAFTLVELLVVVGIIAVLLGIVMPTLSKAISIARQKAGCTANLRRVATACYQYAFASQRRFLPAITIPAGTYGSTTGWGNVVTGNPGCLWLLVSGDYTSRNAFLCPGARNERDWDAPAKDANSFSVINGKSTLSYSYISMASNTNWKVNHAAKMTAENLEPSFVILGDQNPRCTMGYTKLYAYADMNHNDSNADDAATRAKLGGIKYKNSANHRWEGQNVARLDGSAVWLKDPNTESGDDVYVSKYGNDANTDVRAGRRGGVYPYDDTWLIP